jgi:hypothetical protein
VLTYEAEWVCGFVRQHDHRQARRPGLAGVDQQLGLRHTADVGGCGVGPCALPHSSDVAVALALRRRELGRPPYLLPPRQNSSLIAWSLESM